MASIPSRLWILAGMSGAGKRTAVAALEAAGITVIQHLPPGLLAAAEALEAEGPCVALIDSQAQVTAEMVPSTAHVLFLTATDPVLTHRLSESTVRHPLAAAGNVRAQIAAERRALAPLRAVAEVVIDTDELPPGDLGERVVALVGGGAGGAAVFRLVVSSFGVKHGPAVEADWMVDVRFLRNPFWEQSLRPLTGRDAAVRAYVLDDPASGELLEQLTPLVAWTVERNRELGRRSLHLAVACTGGRHRSVSIAEELSQRLRAVVGDEVAVETRHRDVDKPDPR